MLCDSLIPIFFLSVFELLIFPDVSKNIFLEGVSLSRGARGTCPLCPLVDGSQVLEKSGNFTNISETIQPTETANRSLKSVQHKQYNKGFVILSQRRLVEIWILV